MITSFKIFIFLLLYFISYYIVIDNLKKSKVLTGTKVEKFNKK